MFSIDIDPLTDCFMRVVSRYAGCGKPSDGAASHFAAPQGVGCSPQALPESDLLDRVVALAAERGVTVDREVLRAAIEHCAEQPLVTQVSPFRYTVA